MSDLTRNSSECWVVESRHNGGEVIWVGRARLRIGVQNQSSTGHYIERRDLCNFGKGGPAGLGLALRVGCGLQDWSAV